MDLKGIMLSEKRQRKANTISFHSSVQFRKQKNKEKKKRPKEKARFLNTESKLVAAKEEMGGIWVKLIKRINSTFILMSTEKCIDLLNHYFIYLKLIECCILTNWN